MTKSTGGYVGTLFGSYCAFVMLVAPRPAGCVQNHFEGWEDAKYLNHTYFTSTAAWHSPWGDPSDAFIDSQHVGAGKYSMRYEYNFQGGYACHRCHWMWEMPWPSSPVESTYVAWSFWLRGDGSKTTTVYLGCLASSGGWMYNGISIADTTPRVVVIPFSKFVPWDRMGATGTSFNAKVMREIWFGIKGTSPTKGTIYFDNQTFLHPGQLTRIMQDRRALVVDSPADQGAARPGFSWDLRGQAIPRSGPSTGLRLMYGVNDPAQAGLLPHMNRASSVTRILMLRR